MTFRPIIAAISLLLGVNFAAAQWNWPTASPQAWYEAEQLAVCAQIYTALVERCIATGATQPSIVESYAVYAGYSNIVYTNDSVVWTSRLVLTNTYTVTNCFAPFQYSYTDPQGTFTATGMPLVTDEMVESLLANTTNLIGRFVDHRVFGTNYFITRVPTSTWANLTGTDFPLHTYALIAECTGGVLITSSTSTNGYGVTNAATAQFWYGDEIGDTDPIVYVGARSNRWYTQAQVPMAQGSPTGVYIYNYSNINASARYYWATGDPVSVTMRISGTRVWSTNITSNAVQDITFTDTNWVTLTGCWSAVSTATNIAGTASSNDYIVVGYTNPLTYLSSSTSLVVPQRAYWRYFETMRYIINNLLWTKTTCTIGAWTNNWEGEASAHTNFYGTVQTNANADYSYGHIFGSGRHEGWRYASGMLVNRTYSALDRQCYKVAGERTATGMNLATNFAKSCEFYLGAGKVSDVGISNPGVTNSIFYDWGQKWEPYIWTLSWSTNLTTERNVYPFGVTNKFPDNSTSVTNIGGSVPWEEVGFNDNWEAGYGFYSVGRWLVKWDVEGGFTFK